MIPVPIIRAAVSYVPTVFVFKNNSHFRLAKLYDENKSLNRPPLIASDEFIKVRDIDPVDVEKSKKSQD